MPVHREKISKEHSTETKRKTVTREPSITRKVKREKTEDSRPVVTQDKPTKPKAEKISRREPSTSSSVDKNKPEIKRTKPKEKEVVKDRKSEKIDAKVSKLVAKPEKDKPEKKVRLVKTESRDSSRHEVGKIKKESKKDVITMKEVLEKRITARMAKESSLKDSPRSKTKVSDVFGEVIREKPRRDEKEKTKSKESNRGDYISREKSKRERTRTRTLSPTEVKQLRRPQVGAGDAEHSQKLKREDIARGDFNAKMAAVHIANDEDEGEVESVDREIEDEEEDDEYEDDFEDYESDFEEDSEDAQSTNEDGTQDQEEVNDYVPRSHRASISLAEEEKKAERIRSGETERKMDSGIYDMKASLHRKEIDEIKLALQKENYEVTERRKSSAAGLDFEIPSQKIATRDTNSGQMINFSNARKRRQEEKVAAKTKKRGEELLSMISLDAISYSLLEIPATPYDVFMKTYGRSNTQQAHSQTNEDDLDEEIQTDEITLSNKWTQNPPEYSPVKKDGTNHNYLPSKEERLGVGGDVPLFLEPLNSHYNTTRLNEFLTTASEVILTAIESASGNRFNVDKLSKQKNDFPFADGFLQLNVKDVPFLQKRSISSVCLSTKNTANVLSVHEGSINDGDSFKRCMICLWSIREPSKPSKIMVASNQVTCCCFGPNQGNLIFAGLLDGSICLWDLREPSTCHETTKESQSGWTIRSPTYSTAEILRENGHSSKVVAIKLLTKIEEVSANHDFIPIQVCSLEEIGTIIIWTVIQNRSSKKLLPNDDLGLAPWGKVKLIKNASFTIFSAQRDDIPKFHVTCNDLALNEADENGLYITNSLGNVYHLSTYGSYMKPKFYASNKNDATVETTCLEMCPFDSNYFLVGCGDGSIRLHSRHQEFPLICLNGNVIENGKEAAIVSLTWLYMRPCVFFALDSLSRIHIWDLGVSDMYPEVTLNLASKKITCMKLASTQDKRHTPYLVLGSKDGSIEVYRLNKDYGARSPEERKKEMKMFLRYVSIL